MKVNFDTVITDLKGKPLKQHQGVDAPDATLGFVAALALAADTKDDLTQKLATFKLMVLIDAAEGKGEVEITPEQAASLKAKIGAPGFQNAIVVGKAAELLNG